LEEKYFFFRYLVIILKNTRLLTNIELYVGPLPNNVNIVCAIEMKSNKLNHF